jgi:sugar O-acyltransferase (sialic acid O-acetyltransferase NeuD family)
MPTLLVIGAGGHGRAVAEAAMLSGHWSAIAFLDDRYPDPATVDGWPVLGKVTDLGSLDRFALAGAIVAVGKNALREAWCDRVAAAGIALRSVIHPRAFVSPSAGIGVGCAVMAGAVVGPHAVLGNGSLVNVLAAVDHDVVLGEYVHLGVGVALAGGVRIGRAAWLQAGCSAGYGVQVPDGAVIEPGTALTAKQVATGPVAG